MGRDRRKDVKSHARGGCGVYRIFCRENKCSYIGSSLNSRERWYYHLNMLRKGTHYNKHLQRCWNKYGEEAFELRMLETCGLEERLEREQYWLNRWPRRLLLNGSRIAAFPEGTEEVRRGRSDRAKEQHRTGSLGPHTLTEEGKKRRSDAVGRALRGRKMNPDSVAKMAATKKIQCQDPGFKKQQAARMAKIRHKINVTIQSQGFRQRARERQLEYWRKRREKDGNH